MVEGLLYENKRGDTKKEARINKKITEQQKEPSQDNFLGKIT